MNKLSKKCEKNEEDMREEEDNGRGNGKWHDAMRSEGSYTSLFLYSNKSSSLEDDAIRTELDIS